MYVVNKPLHDRITVSRRRKMHVERDSLGRLAAGIEGKGVAMVELIENSLLDFSGQLAKMAHFIGTVEHGGTKGQHRCPAIVMGGRNELYAGVF